MSFEEWWELNKFKMAEKETNKEVAEIAWRIAYDEGILKILELQKQSAKRLSEAYGGL